MTSPAPIPADRLRFDTDDALLLLGAFAPASRVEWLVRWTNEQPARVTALAWLAENAVTPRPDRFAMSLLSSLRRFYSLTERQVEAANNARERQATYAAAEAERQADLTPFTPVAGEQTLTLRVVGAKVRASSATYGFASGLTLKAMCEVTEGTWTGNKVWLTVPKPIRDALGDDVEVYRGVVFVATGILTRWDDEPHMATLKRPQNARLVTPEAGAR